MEENLCLMDLVQDDLNFQRGLVQKNIARMANKPNRMIIQFRDLKGKEDVFILEFKKHDPYDVVVGRVAKKLQTDPLKIRLTRHLCCSDEPSSKYIDFQFSGCLFDIVESSYKVCNVLYYEVLADSQPNSKHQKTVKVLYGYPNEYEISVALPKDNLVRDLLNYMKKDVIPQVMPTNYNAELSLLGIYKHKIFTVFPLEEKIEDIPEFVDLQVEAIPEEKNLGRGHHLIRVHHFTKTRIGMDIGFGTPFLFVIQDGETLAEIKVRIQKKLSVENEEFSKWKFTLLLLGGPKYLEDTDVVSSFFQGEDDVLVQCLGLEHSMTN